MNVSQDAVIEDVGRLEYGYWIALLKARVFCFLGVYIPSVRHNASETIPMRDLAYL